MRLIIFTLFACLSLNAYCRTTPAKEVASFEQDVLDGNMAVRTQKALNTLFGVAYGELVKRGHKPEAEKMLNEWHSKYSRVFLSYAMDKRDIGDHPDQVLIPWFDQKFQILRLVLGDEVLAQTHLADLWIITVTIPIVFKPCTFGMNFVSGERIDEYRRNFNEGQDFFGLSSIVLYWGVYAGVTAATYGTGAMFLSGIVASIGERLWANFVGGKLSDYVFNKSCSEALINQTYY